MTTKAKAKPKTKRYQWRMAHALEGLRDEIDTRSPKRSRVSDGAVGDARHQARGARSDHNPCPCCDVVTARDFTHDPTGGFDSYAFAEWLRLRVLDATHPETRVKYVISNGRIYSGRGQPQPAGLWRPYGGANRHAQHVHVSVRHPAEFYDKAHPWGWEPNL